MQKNRIELAGYLGAKPEVRYLPSGTPVASGRLAEGYRFADRGGQVQEHTNWHNLVFYGDLAEIAVTCEKGDNLHVEGTLQTRKFTPRDGSPRTVFEVVARTVYLIAKPRGAKEPPADNEPHVRDAPTNEPAGELEDASDGEIWPS